MQVNFNSCKDFFQSNPDLPTCPLQVQDAEPPSDNPGDDTTPPSENSGGDGATTTTTTSGSSAMGNITFESGSWLLGRMTFVSLIFLFFVFV